MIAKWHFGLPLVRKTAATFGPSPNIRAGSLRQPDICGARVERQTRELTLWQRYKAGDPTALGELLVSLRPLIQGITLEFTGNLPQAFVEAEVKKQTIAALDTFNLAFNVKLSTHITNYCRKVLREVYRYQNAARLPEATTIKVPAFQTLKANLEADLGHAPTFGEMADTLKISVGEVMRLDRGIRRDLTLVEGMHRETGQSEADREHEILEHIIYELTTQEQQVFEYTFGLNGRQKMNTARIAQVMSLPVAHVSKMKHHIAEVVERFYGHRA